MESHCRRERWNLTDGETDGISLNESQMESPRRRNRWNLLEGKPDGICYMESSRMRTRWNLPEGEPDGLEGEGLSLLALGPPPPLWQT